MGRFLKEGIILVLLTIIIIILLVIALYEYTPKQTLSELETYARTEQTSNVIQEIKTSDSNSNGEQSIIKSYSISAYDLSTYSNLGIYEGERANPFAKVEGKAQYNNSNPGSGTVSSSGGGSNSSTGYFNKTGTNK